MAVTNELFMFGISVLIYVVIAVTWDFQLFRAQKMKEESNNIMKTMIIWLLLYVQTAIGQLSIEYATDLSRSADILTLLTVYYQITVWVLIVVSFYFGIMFLYNVMLYMGVVGGKNG
jgi:hypothetical protein